MYRSQSRFLLRRCMLQFVPFLKMWKTLFHQLLLMNGVLQLIVRMLDLSSTPDLSQWLCQHMPKSFLGFGFLLVKEIILLKLDFVLVVIVSFLAEITLLTRITVLSCSVVTIAFYWPLVPIRGCQFIRLILFNHFFMVFPMMLIFTFNLQLNFLQPHLGMCSNYSEPLWSPSGSCQA